MEQISFLLLFFYVSFFSVLIMNGSSSVEDQVKGSMILFLAKLSGDSAAQANATLRWSLASDPCKDWGGVECNAQNTSITKLFLDRSSLSGTLDAATLCNMQSLSESLGVLSLEDNTITGGLPTEIANCKQLARFHVRGNRFSGDLPASLAMLGNLKGLDISNNNLSGTLPDLSRISGLKTFLAQNNHFSGQIPQFGFSNLDLFNLSFNNFSGPIPVGAERFSADAFEGNPKLCGNPLPQICSTPEPDDINKGGGHSKVNSKDQVIMYIGYAVLGSIFISFILFQILKRSKTREKTKMKIDVENNKPPSVEDRTKGSSVLSTERKMSMSQTEISVASSESGMVSTSLVVLTAPSMPAFKFEDLLGAPAEMLGRGKYGSLYKVVLENGTPFVVKRIKDLPFSSSEFKKRMQALSQVRHPNLLPALAYYCSKEEKLLVYEYQKNGSLFKLLHGNTKSFDWVSRLTVAATISEALCFMHQELKEEGIAHGNLKSSNILLHKNMEPCMSEYGVMVKSEDRQISSSFPTSNEAAPSTAFKADVHSFGVILLELLTGKLVQNDGIDLTDWVRSVLQEEWTVEVFDRSLISEGASEERMVNLLRVAIKCVSESPPSTNQIATIINTLKEEEERSILYEV